jgi:beta-galactosidase
MKIVRLSILVLAGLPYASPLEIPAVSQADAASPSGVKVVWDLDKAYREKTPTRERVCLNGLWRWQPSDSVSDLVPNDGWGYFKVPGSWPGITNYLQKDCQTVHTHPSWKEKTFGSITAAWYQRDISIPGEWAGVELLFI